MSTGYHIHAAGSLQESIILALQKLTRDQVADALRIYAGRERATVGTIIGISHDGVVFSPVEEWHPRLTDALHDLGLVPWIQIHELLGNIPEGSTGDFLKSGGHQ